MENATDRLQAEQELVESQQRFERMANTVPVMLYDSVLGEDGTSRFLYVAPEPCRELFELEPEAVLADMSLIWKLVHPDDLPRFCEEDRTANREGKVFSSEVRIITPSGRLKWLLVNSKPNPAAPGEPAVWSGFLKDITARKDAERKRFDLERRLEQAKKAESLGRMAGAIAHNFNNQLQVVIGNLDFAIKGLPPEAAGTAYLHRAMSASRRAAETTRLMLAYIGQAQANHEARNLVQLCRQSLDQLRGGLPENVSLEADFPDNGPTVSTNDYQLQQVLYNLVANAWEACEEQPGTIRLTIKTVLPAEIPSKNRFPLDWQALHPLYACLEVADGGSGIGEQHMEQLFDPFFTTRFTGRGLGLPVTLGIVRAHQGAISVTSEPGRGSLFQVFLPASAAEEPQTLAGSGDRLHQHGNETVLLVEDERSVRDLAKRMLEDLGYKVLEAGDGIEAVELFREGQEGIDLVLSDMTMPRMNGWELLATLRRQAADLPVILASGYSQAQIMANDYPQQPQVFLDKPYRLAELDAAIRQALAARSGD